MMNLKICAKCKKELLSTLEYFYNNPKSKDGLHSWCKNCLREYSENRYKRNPEKTKKYVKNWYEKNLERRKNKYLEHKFGISIEDYDKMFIEQNGKCAICGIHQSELKKTLHIDHDHNTEEIRSLLCGNCNKGIGFLNENPLILIKSVKYLIESKNKKNIF